MFPAFAAKPRLFEELLDVVVDLVPDLLVENGVLSNAEGGGAAHGHGGTQGGCAPGRLNGEPLS